MAGPLIRLFDAAANRLLRTVGIQPVEELPQGATPEDLQRIIDASEEGGHLDPGLSRLLDRGLDFRGLTAGQAMTPRVDVDTVHADEPVGRVVELLDTGHSRFPITGSDVDDLIGVVGVAEILTVAAEQRATTPVRAVASAPLLVPESLPLPAVLERLRAERRQLACVMDEYGGFAGVITLEDLAEELIGEIHDEDDQAHPVPEQHSDGSWVVPGRLRLDEIADATSLALPAHDAYDTISGLVLRHLGRTAQVGDVVHVDQKFVIEVLEVARHVPQLVRLSTRADADVDVEVRQ
jgi:CBS domain containing-hemolysin-like protein